MPTFSFQCLSSGRILLSCHWSNWKFRLAPLTFHPSAKSTCWVCRFSITKKTKKIPGKAGLRFYKNVGLGFKTPKEAIEGSVTLFTSSKVWGLRIIIEYSMHYTFRSNWVGASWEKKKHQTFTCRIKPWIFCVAALLFYLSVTMK